MDARQQIQSESLPARLLPAALAVVAAALALMLVPAAVAVITIVDGHVLDRTQRWLSSSLALATPYLDLARLGVTLALATAVRTAKEDQ
jgi:putative effector of murein hydrolase LrgA (UPF0299 family)